MKVLLFILILCSIACGQVYRDLDIYKGDSHTLSFETKDDVSSDSLLFVVKADRDDDTPRVITRRNTTGGGDDTQIEVIYSTKSTILVKLTQINTEGLTASTYVYDLTVDSTTTLYTGYLKLRDEVAGSADGIATLTPYYTIAIDTPNASPSFIIGQDSDNGWDVVSKLAFQDTLYDITSLDSYTGANDSIKLSAALTALSSDAWLYFSPEDTFSVGTQTIDCNAILPGGTYFSNSEKITWTGEIFATLSEHFDSTTSLSGIKNDKIYLDWFGIDATNDIGVKINNAYNSGAENIKIGKKNIYTQTSIIYPLSNTNFDLNGSTININTADSINIWYLNQLDSVIIRNGGFNGNRTNYSTDASGRVNTIFYGLTNSYITLENITGNAITNYLAYLDINVGGDFNDHIKINNCVMDSMGYGFVYLINPDNVEIKYNSIDTWGIADTVNKSAIFTANYDSTANITAEKNIFTNYHSVKFSMEFWTANGRIDSTDHIYGGTIRDNIINTNDLGGGISSYIDDCSYESNRLNGGVGSHLTGLELLGENIKVTKNILENGTISLTAPQLFEINSNNVAVNSATTQQAIDFGGSNDSTYRGEIHNNILTLEGASTTGIYVGVYGSAGKIVDVDIYDNIIMSPDYTGSNGIRFYTRDGSHDNTVKNNTVIGFNHGVHVNNDSTSNLRIKDNILTDNTTGAFFGASNDGNYIVSNNEGYLTENYGASSIADGGTIAHGLAGTPDYAIISGSVAGEIVTISSLDGTNITVDIKDNDGSAGTTQTVYWRAYYIP